MEDDDIPRPDYIQALEPWLGKPVIKVLTGMRRVGKSSILRLLAKDRRSAGENVLFFDMESLEHEALRDYRAFYDRVKSLLGGRKSLLLVDEIQEIEGWEKAISSLLAEDAADIVITGSNAKLLSGELATLLAGRAVTTEVWPLSLSEFDAFSAAGENRHTQPTEDARLDRYLRFGGLPGLHRFGFDEASYLQYLDAVYSAIVLKDVVSRIAVRDIDLFGRVVRFAFDNVGNLLSIKNISDFLKSERRGASVDTIANYLTALGDALILHRVPRWDIRGKRHLQISEKYYAGDIGLRQALLGRRSQDIGALIENLVYLELRRRRYRVSVGKLDEGEIDFVAERDNGTVYVQVAYLLDSPGTIERELAPFGRLKDRNPCRLITMDRFQSDNFDGVRRLYLPNFLRGAEL